MDVWAADLFSDAGRFCRKRPATQSRKGVDHTQKWIDDDLEVNLLDLSGVAKPASQIQAYLDSEAGLTARQRYKCRVRKPWYIVPDVAIPDAFISCMSGREPNFAINDAGCVCTNSVLAVFAKNGADLRRVADAWQSPLSRLSQELEGHPLGGGLLKIEPREAQRILVQTGPSAEIDEELLLKGVATMRKWRHLSDDSKVKSAA